MKKLVLAALLPWLCLAFLRAQDQTLPQKLRHLYDPLDKKYVTTGYLWDQSVCLMSPQDYSGAQTDTAKADRDVLGMFYGALRNSFVGQPGQNLPSPSVYLSKIKTPPSDGSIPLSLMTMQFDRIIPDAIESGMLTFDGLQLFDGSSQSVQSNSPYFQDTVFVAAALQLQTSGLQVTYSLPNDLFFNNLGATPIISLDAGDGTGWQNLATGGLLHVNYATYGAKTLRFRLQYPDKTSYAKAKIEVVATDDFSSVSERSSLTWPKDLYEAIPVTASKSYLGTPGQATMHIFYNTHNCNPNKKLLRPLIVLEGYESPGITTSSYTRMLNLLDDNSWSLANAENLTDYLYPYEYDLVYVDLNDGSDWIQRNAFVMEEVIKKVNEMKAAAGSTEQNVIIGVSMGGVAGKYALLDMENTGLQHDTRLFITYDSPLRGANIPIGTQCLVKFMVDNLGDYAGDGISIPSIDLVWGAIQAPTPRQLLLNHVNTLPSSGQPNLQTAFLAEMDAMGALDVRHVALSNGAGNGTFLENSMTAGNPFFLLDGKKEICEWHIISGIGSVLVCGAVTFELGLRATGNNVSTEVFHGHLTKELTNPIHLTTETEWTVTITSPPYDVAPGGNSVLGTGPLGAAPGGLMSAMIAAGVTTTGPGLTAVHHTFIPTFSGVSATPPASLTSAQACGAADRCSMSITAQTATYTGLPEVNQSHIFLDARLADVLINELVTLSAPPLVRPLSQHPNLNTYYNCAIYPHAPVPALEITSSNGKLSINNNGPIGFGVPSDPVSPYNNFDAYTICDAKITVNQGAKLVIGSDDASKHGTFHVTQGAVLHIKQGGVLRITSASSQLFIQQGGTLILDPGAIVQVDNADSRILIEGKLVVNGNIVFSGNGYFEFNGGADQLELGPNANAFVLNGMGKGKRFMKVSTELNIPSGKGLALQNGGVLQKAPIVFGEKGWAEIKYMTFDGDGSFHSLKAEKNPGNFLLVYNDFKQFDQPVSLVGRASLDVSTTVRNCTFSDYHLSDDSQFLGGTGLNCVGRKNVFLESCTFNQGDIGKMGAVFEHNLGVTRMSNCTLTSSVYHSDNSDPSQMAISLDGGWLFQMEGGTIDGFHTGIANSFSFADGQPSPTNILLKDWATISHCQRGVYMEGDASLGTVGMDCARIISVGEACISGKDITLLIDPFIWADQTGDFPRPNVFILQSGAGSQTGDFLNICYPTKVPPNPTPMKSNYWGVDAGGTVTNHVNPFQNIILGRGNNCDKRFSVDINPTVPNEPVTCNAGYCGLSDGCFDDCQVLYYLENGEHSTIKNEFLSGFNDVSNEVEGDALEHFGHVSSFWQPDLTSFTNICHTLIQAGKSLADGEGQARPDDARSSNSKPATSLMRAMPNPATDQLLVDISALEGAQLVQLYDNQGKKVMEQVVNSSQLRFDISMLPAGIYLVRGMGEKIKSETIKIIIEH